MHTDIAPSPPARRSRWRWALLLVPIVALLAGLIAIWAGPRIGGFADCAWSAPVLAWIDTNGNGRWDAGEPPVAGVQFQVNDIYNGYRDVGGKAITDWNGRARVYVWLPGCPRARFEVLAQPPAGYRAASDAPVQVVGADYGSDSPIGFALSLLPGFPTSTPYQAGLACTTATQAVADLTNAPDGTLWLVSSTGAARYRPENGSWQAFPASPGPGAVSGFDRIQVGADGIVWISQRGPARAAAARMQAGSWAYFTGEKTLIAASEPSIGATADGLIWFAPESPPNSLVAYNPVTGQWRALQADKDYGAASVRIFSDGVVWRAAFGYASSYAPPASLPEGWTLGERHVFSPAEIESLPIGSGWLKAAAIDRLGQIWLASSFAVTRLDPRTGESQRYDASSSGGVVSEQLEDLALAPDGSVWLASGREHALAFVLPAGLGRWRQFDPRDGIPDHSAIDHLAVDASGAVWFAFTGEATLARCVRTLDR